MQSYIYHLTNVIKLNMLGNVVSLLCGSKLRPSFCQKLAFENEIYVKSVVLYGEKTSKVGSKGKFCFIKFILFQVWAQGLEGWRLLQQVSQLKWTLLAKGTAVMNESEMSALILSMLTHVCQFYPSKGMNFEHLNSALQLRFRKKFF